MYTSPESNFDFIIVGSGTAGCVLARRLSDSGKYKVLLLEAGPLIIPERTFDPVLWPTQIGSAVDWNYQTVPQAGLNGRTSIEPHGKMVGGSSSINGMMYQRCDPANYNNWQMADWAYSSLMPYFEKVENFVDDEDPAFGHQGLLQLQHRSKHSVHPAAEDFLNAAEVLGYKRISNFDGQLGATGAGYFASNVRHGRRFGAREAYLEPALSNPTLTLWHSSMVTNLLFEGDRCTGVNLLKEGKFLSVYADREVILSASTAESPKLLMLSGIGPPDHLQENKIKVRVSLPGVGGNLHDHLMAVLRFNLAKQMSEPEFAWEVGLFHKSDDYLESPDLETIFNPTAFDKQEPGPPTGITMVVGLLLPQSRGTVRLADDNPLSAPLLDPQFLSDPSDAARLVLGVNRSLEIATTSPLKEWVAGLNPVMNLPEKSTNHDMTAWIRQNALSQYHMAGTCQMGTNNLAVVDAQLKVYGTRQLRVVDASVIPRIVSGHCQAAVFAIAERASDIILKEHA